MCLTFGHFNRALAVASTCSDLFTDRSVVFSNQFRANSSLLDLESQQDFRNKLKNGTLFKFKELRASYMKNQELHIYETLSENFFELLNKNEAYAFRSYTSKQGTYDAINMFVENPNRKGIDRKTIAPLAGSMLDGFPKASPLPKGTLLFRGMSFNDGAPIYEKGQQITVRRFSSTSLSPAVAHEFATREFKDDQDIWIIEIADDKIVGFFANNVDEAEVILQSNIKLKIKKISTSSKEFGDYGTNRVIYALATRDDGVFKK